MITPKQQRAILALMTSKTVDGAADLAGVNRRTIYRWMGDPTFRAALDEAEAAALNQFSRRLLDLQGKALDALGDVLDNPEAAGAWQKIRAAQVISDNLLRLREIAVIERRITDLESRWESRNA